MGRKKNPEKQKPQEDKFTEEDIAFLDEMREMTEAFQ